MVTGIENDPKAAIDSARKQAEPVKAPPALRRINGFGCPPHGFQIAAILANIWSCFFYFSLHALALYGWLQYLFIAAFAAAVLVHIIFFIVATAIDPADPNVRAKSKNSVLPVFDRSRQKHVIENLTCAICEVKVGLKSKHCSACNKCVWNFDHHCPWLNNCVGGANYRFFITTVVSADLGLFMLFGLAVAQLVTYFSDVDSGNFLRPYYDRLNYKSDATLGYTTPVAGFNSSFTSTTTAFPPAVFTLVGASVPDYVWLIFVCIDILLAAIGIGLLSHLLVFHCYLASHHLSTYDYITLQQQPTTVVDDGVSVAEEGQPCSGRASEILSESYNGYPSNTNYNGNMRHSTSNNNNNNNGHVSSKQANGKQGKQQELKPNVGCSALGNKQSKVDVMKAPGETDSVSTVSARVLTADSGRYTGVDNAGNPPNSHRGGIHLAPISSVGLPLSSRSPRQRRRRTRLNNKNQPEENGDGGPNYDADYQQQLNDLRATFPVLQNGAAVPHSGNNQLDRPFNGRQTAGLLRDGNGDGSVPPEGISPLPLPPPSPMLLPPATAASSVWRTTDRSSVLETDSRMFGDINNSNNTNINNNNIGSMNMNMVNSIANPHTLALPPLGVAKLQLPLSSTTNYAIGTNPLLAASFESNFSQYSLRSAAPYGDSANLFASKFGSHFGGQQLNNNNGLVNKHSGFVQPSQLLVGGGADQAQNGDYLIPRLSLSHSSFA